MTASCVVVCWLLCTGFVVLVFIIRLLCLGILCWFRVLVVGFGCCMMLVVVACVCVAVILGWYWLVGVMWLWLLFVVLGVCWWLLFVVLNLDCVYCRVLRGCDYLLRLAACVLDFVGVLLYADYVAAW